MQTASDILQDALNNGHEVKSLPHLTAEWNHNRFAGILKVDCDLSVTSAALGAAYATMTKDEAYNPNLAEFPITSIVEPNRPDAGIVKARTAKHATSYYSSSWTRMHPTPTGEESFTAPDYSDISDPQRFYTVGSDSQYKYWASHGISSASINGQGGYSFSVGQEVNPYVIYKTQARTNKIVLKFENSWANPKNYSIQTTVNGGTVWTTVASNIVPDPVSGRVTIYRQDDGTWGTTPNFGNPTSINGVRLSVTDATKGRSHINVIEISARLEEELTSYLTGWDYDATISDKNFLTPLGKASSNVGNITLFNDGTFNNENVDSPYYNIIDKNIKMMLDLTYDLTDLGGGYETIRQFTAYVEDWGSQGSLDASITLKDSSMYFQEQTLNQIFIDKVTVGEAIWRICDSIGFTRYVYDKTADSDSTLIDYFWSDKNATVWDTLSKLAEGTQSAIFFDEYDYLRIRTRDAAFDKSAPVSWTFEATNAGGKLADIIDLEDEFDFESNKVNIQYKNTHLTDFQNGFPVQEVVWQPEGDFVLRASELMVSMTDSSTFFKINPAEVATWPYSGVVSISGELIKYNKKQYTYYNKSNVLTYAWIASLDEKNNIDKTLSSDTLAFKNTFTGYLLVEERGYLWSGPRAHDKGVLASNYGVIRTNSGSASESPVSGMFHTSPAGGYARINTPRYISMNDWIIVRRGGTLDTAPKMYGTRFKIDKAATGAGRGGTGIHFMDGTGGVGYYVEILTTAGLDGGDGAERNFAHEVSFFSKTSDGAFHRYGDNLGKGARRNIYADVWYTLEVEFTIQPGTGNHLIAIWLNGTIVMRVNLTPAQSIPVLGRWGLFQRGQQVTDFDFLYGIDNGVLGAGTDLPDDISSWNFLEGGYTSNQFAKEYTFSLRDATRRVGNKSVTYKQKYNQYVYDEFGPVVREVREMNIEFTKSPCVHSKLYFTNDAQAVCAEYVPTPFGARFFVANSSRRNAILNGTEKDSAGNSISHQMFIYGRVVTQDDGAVETVQNIDRIRRSGENSVDFESKYIQSKDDAVALGQWIVDHWADGTENISITTFGNPLVQIGDRVAVDYPIKFIGRSTHRYFVTGVKRNWSNGLETSFQLRRTA